VPRQGRGSVLVSGVLTEPMTSHVRSVDCQVDVLILSDLRFPGGTSHSVAEEIAAQAQSGWSTGLVQMNGPLLSKVMPVNRRIRGQIHLGRARLFLGDGPIRAKIVVLRHPAVLEAAADQLPPIETEHAVLVANAPPIDIDGYRHYRPAAVDRIARERFGVAPIWAPIGPLVRGAIASEVRAGLHEEDWVNIIDVDAWHLDRSGWQSSRPVIGRHSRPSPQKWPTDPKVIEAVYPVDGSVIVKILGGADPVRDALGYLPNTWQVTPFGSMDPREFLAQLDFFVYYHHPAWIEAFGRNILEALASGLPAILPPHFRPLFGDAAIYAKPADVRSVLSRLYRDRAAYQDIVACAESVVRARFSYQSHQDRLAQLIGPPKIVGQHQPTGSPSQRAAPERPSVLLISSNGAGMGHLTRLMAYARRVEHHLAPHFLSLSQAVGVVGRYGYPFEYVPSVGVTGLSSKRWHDLFTERLSDVVARLRPAVVVFDGTWPYDGIQRVRDARPEVRWVWSRRGMWRRGKSVEQLTKAAWFDEVLAPGELAQAYDKGATSDAAGVRLGPVTLLDADELDDRDAARRMLGLPPDRRLALVALGAGNINDTSLQTEAAMAALQRLGVDICVTQTEIAQSDRARTDVHIVREFPLSRRFRAFDLAVSASGYNSFHELLRFGIPTLFIPNQDTALDDQEGRARFASDRGLAHMLGRVTVPAAAVLLDDLLCRGEAMVANVPSVDRGNGAVGAAAHLCKLAGAGVGRG
jgi:UDP:flavonoid glycosyltransferase YjiC (YdhE family)/glycosyltransferase involved in cell wall biosynthesis